jgi:magnesium transporter
VDFDPEQRPAQKEEPDVTVVAEGPPPAFDAEAEVERDEPWKRAAELVDASDRLGLAEFLEASDPSDLSRTIERLDRDRRGRLLDVLGPEASAELMDQLVDAQCGELLEAAEPSVAAGVLEQMPSDEQADLIAALDPEDAVAVLAELPADVARLAEEIAGFSPDSAGGLMNTDIVSFRQSTDAGSVVSDLRRRADQVEDDSIQYIYVTDGDGRLTGVLRLRDLLLSPSWRTLEDFMIRSPLAVQTGASLDELLDVFDARAYLGVPVVDDVGVLRGVVQRADVQEASGERSERDHRRSQGIIDEELRSMRLVDRSRSRLAWLSVNILLNILAASIIAAHQDTLEAVIALAVFLPIISDMSGCSGNQAVAVSMRELALGAIKPKDVLWVWRKEVQVGLINGAALGLLIGAVAWIWKGNAWLGLVVGAALSINTVIAVSVGGAVPLVLKRFGKDPALASGPILTTVTDMCGFLLVLSIASALMPHLI